MIPHGTYATNLRLACSALSVKGAIVECGTWKGGMIAGIAMLFGGRRSYYLYDSFEGLPPVQPIDGKAANEWQNNTESEIYFDNCTASELHAAKAMSLTGVRDCNTRKKVGLKTPSLAHPFQMALPFYEWMQTGINPH